MSTVNLYDVLNIAQDADIKTIKYAYRNLAKEFHPDKPNGNEEMFELITHAYNILINPLSRQEYDKIYKLSKNSDNDHLSLKNNTLNYIESQKSSSKKKTKQEKEYEFKKVFKEMDRKHNYKRTINDNELNLQETDRLLNDLTLSREHDDIENTNENLFEDREFVLSKFNAAFDMMHKKPTDLIKHTGNPDAYNTINSIDSNYSSLDNFENIYADDNTNLNEAYGTINQQTFNKVTKKLSKHDIDDIQAAEYTINHAKIDKKYDSSFNNRLQEYKKMKDEFDNCSHNDFDIDPTCGGYGIFHQLEDIKNIEWNDNKDIKQKYQKLIELRKNQFND